MEIVEGSFDGGMLGKETECGETCKKCLSNAKTKR